MIAFEPEPEPEPIVAPPEPEPEPSKDEDSWAAFGYVQLRSHAFGDEWQQHSSPEKQTPYADIQALTARRQGRKERKPKPARSHSMIQRQWWKRLLRLHLNPQLRRLRMSSQRSRARNLKNPRLQRKQVRQNSDVPFFSSIATCTFGLAVMLHDRVLLNAVTRG